jgi:sugar lactone lactonase YvrE
VKPGIMNTRFLRHAIGFATGCAPACALAQGDYATPYAFTTLAGAAVGSADGTGMNAQFNFSILPGTGASGENPFFLAAGSCCLATDSAGNLYVADSFNDVIRKISPAGVVSTLAGMAGQSGTSDGTGSAARFQQPLGIAVDSSGNVYVADTGNYTIRKITPAGVVTTLAGTPGVYNANGDGGLFDSPTGLAVDTAGNVYVADTGNNAIYKISQSGAAAVLAGDTHEEGVGGYSDGTGTSAQFKSPYGIALDGADNLYVADAGNDVIRKVTPAGVVTTFAGSAGVAGSSDGTGSTARFNDPDAVAIDSSGNIFVSDSGNSTVRRITSGGSVTTIAGMPGVAGDANGEGAAALFLSPVGLALDGQGDLFVADNDAVREIARSGAVTDFAGAPVYGNSDGTGAAAQFNWPTAVAVDGTGTIYVADTLNSTVRKITQGGVVTTFAGMAGKTGTADATGTAARFSSPIGVAVDGDGNIYVADSSNENIRKITPAGAVSTFVGKTGTSGSADGTGSSAEFDGPEGLAADGVGNIYVADSLNDTIRKVTPAGVVSTLAGSAGQFGNANGSGSAAQFDFPISVALDSSGNVYVGELSNYAIRKITPGGNVTTFVGNVAKGGYADGAASNALFLGVTGITVDASDNLYVADYLNDAIRKVSPAGFVTTLAGYARVVGSSDGTGRSATFKGPWGIAKDGAGNLFVADSSNNLIREGSLAVAPVFSTQPVSQAMSVGSTVVITAATTGASSFQWDFNGQPLNDSSGAASADVVTGATGPQLLISNATGASSGSYTLVATNSTGSTTSSAATLQVAASSNPGVLISLSARGFVGTGDNILIGGFYIVGDTSATVLVQAMGPALAASPYSVSGTLRQTSLSIHQSQNGNDVVLYSNSGWGSSPALLAAASAAYAVPVLVPGSGDSELLLTLPPGGYTAEVSGVGGTTGVALCAVYQLP